MFSAGTGLHDLTEIRTIDLHEPRGWQAINVGDYGRKYLPAFPKQIVDLVVLYKPFYCRFRY